MIYKIQRDMYNNKIEITIKDKKTMIDVPIGQDLPAELYENIKKHKKRLLERIAENEAAKKLGFLIYDHGLLYEYRYGLGAYLFIERQQGGLATAWRANYAIDKQEPYKTITLARNVPFQQAYDKAVGFVEWMRKRRY